jgi:putative CocE/NonD family hydrolase
MMRPTELSSPSPDPEVIEEHDVMVPMRDGVCLGTDIWRPRTDMGVPVLVSRTPYSKDMIALTSAPEELAAAGFAVVLQDCRGRFSSEGNWGYVHCEVDDGYDTVEWAAAQSWANGRVGMFGASYMGYTQWLAAVARPPHLEVMAPECCAADYWAASFDSGGSFRLALRLGWTASLIATMAPEWGIEDPVLERLRQAFLEARAAVASGDPQSVRATREATKVLLDDVYRMRPIMDNPLWYDRATWLDEIFRHESRDDSNWRLVNPSTHYGALDLPAVHVGGWYDIHLEGTLRNYMGMCRQAPTERARLAQRLIIGPWSHWTPQLSVVGDVDFGPSAALDPTALRLQWFRHWLQEKDGLGLAPVRIFVMGLNAWRDEQEWPLARTRYAPWYLGLAGRLGPMAPAAGEGPDSYVYDPRDPVPTLGGRLLGSGEVAGPFDQRRLGSRPDVLEYTSEPLGSSMEITGPVTARLWVSSDVPDTDFTAVLMDVHPDGSAWNLCEGGVRVRHAGIGTLMPGAVYQLPIDLVATSAVVAAGHRLRLHVSSSSFPEWEPNPNSGQPVGLATEADLRVAHQTVYHDAYHPSHVVLPFIPN